MGLLNSGCRPETAATHGNLRASIAFDPNPPAVGDTQVIITLTDAEGRPVRIGRIEAEGNMNHAGMKPVFTRLDETDPGRYVGTLEFTMAGDWFLLVSGQFQDGSPVSLKVNVPGVKPR